MVYMNSKGNRRRQSKFFKLSNYIERLYFLYSLVLLYTILVIFLHYFVNESICFYQD